MAGRAVLAFSGGLDTSVAVRYLQEELGMEVVTVTVDVGQGGSAAQTARRARALGVKGHHTIDARDEFVRDYVLMAIKANALYESKYSLATALARPLIAKKVVEVARKERATALAHGCSGKGNDQVRFDVTMRALSGLPIVAPIRDMDLDRPTELDYARRHGVHVESVAKKYSVDQNLWGRAVEGGPLEDAAAEPPADAFEWVSARPPARPTHVVIGFERGAPVSLGGRRMAPRAIIERLNRVAGGAGVGIVDHVEDRVVGLKSREVYEAPAATCLIEAHADLEKAVHTRLETRFKGTVDAEWAWLAYSGLWEDPLRASLEAYIERSQRPVSGTVRLRLQGGSVRAVGRSSPRSLYSARAATYGRGSSFEQSRARGFVELWGLQSTEAVKLDGSGAARREVPRVRRGPGRPR
ncbi:MAG: argininosuccinate synthase [Thaumarchaeota archaeon]|nr:argininosuccinate synthase [Nitrososphaerota archaeon]